jgi:hypothetical protein
MSDYKLIYRHSLTKEEHKFKRLDGGTRSFIREDGAVFTRNKMMHVYEFLGMKSKCGNNHSAITTPNGFRVRSYK